MKKKKEQSAVYSGLSGLQLPIPKYLFPPAHQNSSRLTYYSTFFNSIEINSSFYKIPLAATVRKWSEMVPANFQFTFKLYKEITHSKGLNFKVSDIELFFKAINAVESKKGCVLVQFPPSVGKEYLLQLNELLRGIAAYNPAGEWKVAVEFRNKSWYHPDVYNLLDDLGTALVVHDIPKSATPSIPHTSSFIYLRFHGPTGNYRDSYPESFLHEYSGYIIDWVKEHKMIYVYFNNTMGDAFKNLQTLNNLI